MPRPAAWLLAGGFALTAPPAMSDEGMFLPTALPAAQLKAKYGFDLTPAFGTKLMRASVRFAGASGGFVSPDGLVVTNHHVGADGIQKLGTRERDLLRVGFYAATRDAELRCPDLELNVLRAVEDVTARVTAAVPPDAPADTAAAARRAALSTIEKEATAATGLKCEVVTLYQGGLYHLYQYKKYTDVRLVFAPEQQIASFGGDVDNFEYPRHALDVAFFRAYENGAPAKTPDHFRWSKTGPADGELVLVTGHPGTTNRLETLARLEHRRDVTLPYELARLRALEAALIQFSEQSPEQRRQAAAALHGVANSRKAFAGQLQGLLDPGVLAAKRAAEGPLAAGHRAPFDRVAAAQTALAGFAAEFALVERGDAFSGQLFSVARHLVRLAAESPKPNADRLREYRDSNRPTLTQQLLSPAPVYPGLERQRLQTALTFLAEKLGGAHPLVVTILAGQNPADRAAGLVAGTKLADVPERQRLLAGGAAAVAASTDPLIVLARTIDPAARAVRKRHEDEVEEPERQAYAAIAKARFAATGTSTPPDATGTLRLAFGTVRGYEADGRTHPAHTTFGSAFAKAAELQHADPFVLPKRWRDGEAKLDPNTPLDFVSTADTIGGNSGSPVLNRAGELVGVNFDRNRFGLVRNFVYTDVQARHVAVHSRAVLDALAKLYGAEGLVAELTGGKP